MYRIILEKKRYYMLKWYSVWTARLNYLPYVMNYVIKTSKSGICLFYIFISTGHGYGRSCGVRGALNRGGRVEWVTRLTEVLTRGADPKNLARKFADDLVLAIEIEGNASTKYRRPLQ